MLIPIPAIHALQLLQWVGNGKNRPLSQHLEFPVGHHTGDFENRIRVCVQPSHLQIDPDQVVIMHDSSAQIACR